MTRVGEADPEQFWEPVKPEDGNRIVLTPKDFYLLMSYEAVRIPSGLAAEMTAYDPTSRRTAHPLRRLLRPRLRRQSDG